MANEALFRIRTQMASNADQYARELAGAMNRVAQAARTPAAAGRVLTSVQGRETAALRGLQQRGAITEGDYRRALQQLEDSIDRARQDISRRLSQTLGRPVTISRPTAQQVEAAATRAAPRGGPDDLVALRAQERLERQQLNRSINAETRQRRQISGDGTLFQRAQQYISGRQGQEARPAASFQTGSQFLASRALTTAGFASSGPLGG